MRRGVHAGLAQHNGVGINVLSEGDLDQIHLRTLEVLDRTGIWVEDDDALNVFADGGCRVDRETRMVKIPPHVVEDAIRSTPATFTLCGRDSKNDVVFGGDRIHFMNFGEATKVDDIDTGVNRPSTLADIALAAKLIDWCDEIDMEMNPMIPMDAPTDLPWLTALEVTWPNLTKPVLGGPMSQFEYDAVLKLAAVVAGGEDKLRERPLLIPGGCMVSPLRMPREVSKVWLSDARHGIPANINSMPMSGATAPKTLAATLMMNNAEVLAAITLLQLAGRGTPCLYSTSMSCMDLRFAAEALGSPESSLLTSCYVQLGRRYQIPVWCQGL